MFAYFVSVNTSDAELSSLPIFKNLAKFNEAKIRSKLFNGYKECLDTAQSFTADVVSQLNASKPDEFFIQTGVNPEFGEDPSGMQSTGALNRWANNELLRLYVMSKSNKDASGVFLTKFVVSILSKPYEKEN